MLFKMLVLLIVVAYTPIVLHKLTNKTEPTPTPAAPAAPALTTSQPSLTTYGISGRKKQIP